MVLFDKNLSDDDKKVWNSYIKNIHTSTNFEFNIDKRADVGLKKMLDLHNKTIQEAFYATRDFINEHYSVGSKNIKIVCGKGGKIADEFPDWCKNIPCIRNIKPIVDSKGECGSYMIFLKK